MKNFSFFFLINFNISSTVHVEIEKAKLKFCFACTKNYFHIISIINQSEKKSLCVYRRRGAYDIHHDVEKKWRNFHYMSEIERCDDKMSHINSLISHSLGSSYPLSCFSLSCRSRGSSIDLHEYYASSTIHTSWASLSVDWWSKGKIHFYWSIKDSHSSSLPYMYSM